TSNASVYGAKTRSRRQVVLMNHTLQQDRLYREEVDREHASPMRLRTCRTSRDAISGSRDIDPPSMDVRRSTRGTMRQRLAMLTVGAGAVLVTALAAQPPTAVERFWPQWRGPHATGASSTANPPVEWSETRNVRWKIEIPGRGSGTPVVWG